MSLYPHLRTTHDVENCSASSVIPLMSPVVPEWTKDDVSQFGLETLHF